MGQVCRAQDYYKGLILTGFVINAISRLKISSQLHIKNKVCNHVKSDSVLGFLSILLMQIWFQSVSGKTISESLGEESFNTLSLTCVVQNI